tara:strand:+ start:3368 stop:4366 length:999 start_codon:yes stop_codon:yes gene_type:complete
MISKIAIVGSGFGMYCLLPAFSRVKDCKIVGISGKNSERMTEFCKKFDVKHYSNWKEMIVQEKPDGVAIAVVPQHQYEIARYALEKGIGVFAEKPLTTSYESSVFLNDLAKKKELPNMVDFIFTQIPQWIEAKKILESGEFGEILHVDVNWTFLSHDIKNKLKTWKTDVKQGGGALSLVFSHILYYLEFFLGSITNIESKIFCSELSLNHGETKIELKFNFGNNRTGYANLDISIPSSNHSINFKTQNGNLILENRTDSFVDNFDLIMKTGNKTEKIQLDNLENMYDEDPRIKVIVPLAKRFVNWCNFDQKSKPDFEDGMRVQKLIEISRNN